VRRTLDGLDLGIAQRAGGVAVNVVDDHERRA
jgi:hypothetical protein